MKALFLIDGVHKPDNTVYSIKELCKMHSLTVGTLVWIGGTEKLKSKESFSKVFKSALGVDVIYPPNAEEGIKKVLLESQDIKTVIQLSGAPQINRSRTIALSLIAVSLGAQYIAGGTTFKEFKSSIKHKKPSLGIYATDKRVGKTAFGSYIGNLLCGIHPFSTVSYKPIIITHSRGGPPDPPLIEIYKKTEGASKSPPGVSGKVEELTIEKLLSSRFKPEYLTRLLDFGLHGASDVFEDALILSLYLDKWERCHKGDEVPYISLIGCRRAGAGYFNEFVVSNVARGIEKANNSPSGLIIHEGSGAEHPPVDVDGIIFLVPSDVDLKLLSDFPHLEKSILFIMANCQNETTSPDRVKKIMGVLNERAPGVDMVLTRFVPEIVDNNPCIKGRKVAFFTTAPAYILDKLSTHLKETYHCDILGIFNNLDSDIEMKKSIEQMKNKVDLFLFEIKARGVEGAANCGMPYYYVNNIPQIVDKNFNDAEDNTELNEKILTVVESIKGHY